MTQPSATGSNPKLPELPPRDRLAMIVFLIAALAIVTLGGFVMWYGGREDRGQVFTTTLPVFAAWVGTVLAFYFSRENFEAANANVRAAIQQLTPEEKLAKTAVRDVWTPRSSIRGVELNDRGGENDVFIKQICADLSLTEITRIPVFAPGGPIKYVLHESMVYKFISDNSLRGTPINPAQTTLANFLAHKSDDGQEMRSIVSRMAFVPLDATLAEARARMVAVAASQDVFVTKTGKPTEPVEGWLTNADIAKAAGIQ